MTLAQNASHGCGLFAGLAEVEIGGIVRAARQTLVRSGQVVCRQGDQGDSMFLILSGRVCVSVDRVGEGETTLNHLGTGHHFGELSMLVGGPRTATVRAVMDTELLELGRREFHHLMATIPGFAANLSRTLGIWLRGELRGRRHRDQITTVAIVRSGPAAHGLAPQLVGRLAAAEETTQVLTDRPHLWPPARRTTLHAIGPGRDATAARSAVNKALASAGETGGRVVVDVAAERAEPALLMQCERVWWLADPAAADAAGWRLTELLAREEQLGARTQLVWLHRLGDALPPPPETVLPVRPPCLRIGWLPNADAGPQFRPHDLARLVHHLQGVHLGLALGGGGARGVAHIGVLEVLEKAGLYFDRIVGTSAGAMLGAMYAAGYPVGRLLELVEQELTPPRWMRFLPKSERWYLLAMYRLGLVDPKLRRYLFDYTFDQLLTPMHTVSVDLITGTECVRESGDVVSAILESINLPVLSAPILRDGAVLVDGGVLVNVPASVLRKFDASFVLAVDVGSRLVNSFGGNTTSTPLDRMRRPGLVETAIRLTEVQQRGLASIHAADADYVLAPDTSAFPFDNFTRARELVDVGRAAAEKAVPEIRQRLANLGSLGARQRQAA